MLDGAGHEFPVDKLFYTPEQAAVPLEMGLDAIEAWMASGHLKYACEGPKCKRRIWRNDLLAFAEWYRKEHLVCPSTSPEIKPGTRKARSGNMTLNVVALDFADRSMAKADVLKSGSTGQKKKPSARKRSLELTPPPKNRNDHG